METYQVVEILERSPYRSVSSDPMPFRQAAELFGKRWAHVLEIYLIDEHGCTIAHHACKATWERAPFNILHDAGLECQFRVVADYYGGEMGYENDQSMAKDSRRHHYFSSHTAATDAARAFDLKCLPGYSKARVVTHVRRREPT